MHEARGLDVLPATIAKFRKHGDEASAELLELVVYPEEVTHCAAGVRWFTHLHERGERERTSRAVDGAANAEGESGEGRRRRPRQEEEDDEALDDAATAAAVAAVEEVRAEVDAVVGIPPGARLLERFHAIVRHHFSGVLKPPFNDEARARAGFGPEWYMPLSVRPVPVQSAPGLAVVQSARDPAGVPATVNGEST